MRTNLLRCVLVLLMVGSALVVPQARAAEPFWESGYIEMPDGVELRYTVVRPSEHGRYPVALIYDVYCEGWNPLRCNVPQLAPRLLAEGYAVLGVNLRGTGCSGGSLDLLSRLWGADGARAVEWAALRSWSTGNVGMIGLSFPGPSQLAVAAFQPRGLKAIAPLQPTTDWYGDVAYPGGVPEVTFIGFWGLAGQPAVSTMAVTAPQSALSPVEEIPREPLLPHALDDRCRANVSEREPANTKQNLSLEALLEPYRNERWATVPDSFAEDVRVPALMCVSWQDDQVGSRNGTTLDRLDRTRTWFVGMNGFHGQCEVNNYRLIDLQVRFFDRFVKGERNGFDRDTPRVQLWHEAVTTAPTGPLPGGGQVSSHPGSMSWR